MILHYDFHVHGCLSPCADDDMTPANVVGFAKLIGLDAVALADHNAIANVQCAMQVGEAYGITVVPAMELQTCEDIHLLCLFPTFQDLQQFYDEIDFPFVQNNSAIFGNQLVVDCDDVVVGEEKRLLLMGADVHSHLVPDLAAKHHGVAVAAHVDRQQNGMVAILGCVTQEFKAIELSATADESYENTYADRIILRNSDAHTLQDIGKAGGTLVVQRNDAQSIINAIKGI